MNPHDTNKNLYASPVETPETLSEEPRPLEKLPPKMAWVKWGMVWIAGCMVWLLGGELFLPYIDWVIETFGIHIIGPNTDRVIEIFIGFHIVGMIFCCLCPMKWRWRLIGWISILLVAVYVLGRQSPLNDDYDWVDWLSKALGAGVWLWLVFLLILSLRIRSPLCIGLACVVLMCDTFVCVMEFTHGFFNMRGTYWMLVPLLGLVVYPLLIVCLWVRIRGMLRAGR